MARKLGELFLDVDTRLKKLEKELKKQNAAVAGSAKKQKSI